MKKTILNISLILALASTTSVFAQQGIGTNNPDKSAALEIASTNKGLLIPRMNLTWVSNAINAPIVTPAKGLLVYNTTSISNVPEGFYYFDGTKWVPIGTTVLQDSNTTTISGNGTASNPYKVEVNDLAGDVTGSILTNKVQKIQNFPVSATAPSTGQVLKEVAGVWTPSTLKTTDVSDSKALTTTSPLKVNAANSEANAVLADVNLSVDKATETSLGVVQVGNNINVDANGVISVNFPTATVDTNTTTTVSTDQSYVTIDKTQTVGLETDAVNTRDYKIGVDKATASTLGVVMPGTGLNVDTDGKLNVVLDGSETKLANGTNTTVTGTGTTADAYKVNVATANGTELGVVQEAATNPTVNVSNGVLAVNLSNTTLSGEVTGPLNATEVANDVIDAANLKTDAVTTVKIANNTILGEDLNVNVAGNGLSQANNGALQINASNGLTVDATNDVVQLGGNLTKTTTITQNGNPFNIVTAGTALTISGLPNTASTQYNAENGVGSDRIVVADTNGLLKEMKAAMPKFFYAPSIALPTAPDQIVVGSGITESSGVYTVQLHTIYSNQFGGTFTTGVSNTGKVSNTNRTTVLPTLAATDLDYYITFFDTSVFSDVTISNAGVMTYKIKTTADVTIGSFMNIVFVVKP